MIKGASSVVPSASVNDNSLDTRWLGIYQTSPHLFVITGAFAKELVRLQHVTILYL